MQKTTPVNIIIQLYLKKHVCAKRRQLTTLPFKLPENLRAYLLPNIP